MYKVPEVCILPVAGLSSRNLPATKVIHKGLLTLHNRPIIQYAVDAAAEIGCKEIVFIYSDEDCKSIFGRYFSKNEWLEDHLEEKGKLDLLKELKSIIPSNMKFSFAEQSEAKGNGHAVLMAKEIVGKRDFIVMWPDDVYLNLRGSGVLKQLGDVYQKYGGMVQNIMEFPKDDMVRYGALVKPLREGNVVHASDLVEKPALENVPSNYAAMGPYMLPNEIMDILPEVKKGGNGEINLTDAISLAANRGTKYTGVLCDAMRLDCGTNLDLCKSNIKLSLMEDPSLRSYAKELLDSMVL